MPTRQPAGSSQPLSTPSQPSQHQHNTMYPRTPSTQPPASTSFSPGNQATQSPANWQAMGLQNPTQNEGSYVSQPADSFRQWLPTSQASAQPQGTLSQAFSQGSQASGGTSQASGGLGTAGVSNQAMHQAMESAIQNALQSFTGGSQTFNTPTPAAAAQPEKMCNCNPPQVCVTRSSKKDYSYGRQFFACPKPQGQQCKG